MRSIVDAEKLVDVNHAMASQEPSVHVPVDQVLIRATLQVVMRNRLRTLATGRTEQRRLRR